MRYIIDMTTTHKHQIDKQYAASLIGGLGGRTRRECWKATIDGIWLAERLDDIGTDWTLTHIASGETVQMLARFDGSATYTSLGERTWGSLAKVIRSIDNGEADQSLAIVGAAA